LLWFFTISTSITLGVLVATLFGYQSSGTVIASFLATSLVTVLAYGAFYAHYLYRLRAEPALTTGRVWSIITIVLHSVVVLGALITFIATLINAEEMKGPLLTGAAAIAGLDLLVVAAYVAATFLSPLHRLRKMILLAYPVLVVLLVGGFAAAGLAKLGPIQADENVRHDLVKAAKAVKSATEKNNDTLPQNAEKLDLPAGITYKRTGKVTYELCASFKSSSKNPYEDTYSDNYVPDDGYVSDYDFTRHKAGETCFKIKSRVAEDASFNEPARTEPAPMNDDDMRRAADDAAGTNGPPPPMPPEPGVAP
jgi:hypothetical protein